MRLVLRLIAFGVAISSPAPSMACTVPKPFELRILKNAEVVIRAEVVGYTPAKDGGSVLQLDATEMLAGSVRGVKRWTPKWIHSTGRDEWVGSPLVILGLRAVIGRDGAPVIEIVDDICRGPSILEDTPQNLKSVKDLLSEPPGKG